MRKLMQVQSVMEVPATPSGIPQWYISTRRRKWNLAFAVLVVVGVNAAFLFSFWNKFLAPSISGMFLEFASRLLQGAVPYRDFYVVVTPFYIFKTAILVHFFGPRLEVLRFVEIIYRCILGAVLLIWLARLVRVRYALVATLAGSIILSTDPADSLTSYHQEAIFWAVIGAFFISYVPWDRSERLKEFLLLAAGGFCCSLSFFTKQTVGGGIVVALAVAIASLSLRDRGFQRTCFRLFAYCAGFAIPTAALFLWLADKGALGTFLRILFLDGPSAKGSLLVTFTRILYDPNPSHLLRVLYLPVAAGTMIAVVLIARRAKEKEIVSERNWKIAFVAAASLAALAVGYEVGLEGSRFGGPRVPFHWSILAGLSFFGALAFAIYYAVQLFRRRLTPVERQRWILALVSIWIAYTLSWSASPWGPMGLPALAIVIAFVLQDLGQQPWERLLKYGIAAFVPLLLLTFEYGKVVCPFAWQRWVSPPISRAVATSDQPVLHGIRMAPRIAEVTDEITETIEKYSHPGEPVYIYSFQPLWYVMSDRWPPTYAQVHYFDVAPDNICRSDALRILKARPPVIVDFDSDPKSLTYGEAAFRGGKPSGQRYLHDRMYQLIGAEYRLQASLSYPASQEPVKIYVRKDRQ